MFSFYNNYFNLYWFFFNLIFNSLTQVFFNKLRFRGKGYYIYKNHRNTIAFQFGYSHRVRIFTHFLNAKFLSKITLFFYGVNKFDIIRASYLFYYKRPISIFTGKGVRFTRQVIYKKTGKISSYR
jgi:ribosomal protein L6P/L9E